MSDSFGTIKTSHGLGGDTEKLDAYYKDWAGDYDKDVLGQGYGGPRVAADLALLVADAYLNKPVRDVSVLDAGCGTGLAGVEMVRRGFKDIDGFDLSQEMCDVAEKTGAFGKMVAGVDLNADQANAMGRTYDLLTVIGVFTLGHVEPEGLLQLIDYTNPGGYIIVSTRLSYYKGTDYQTVSDRYVEEGRIEFVSELRDARYIDEEGAHYFVYRKPA